MAGQNLFRKLVGGAFALVTLVAGAFFNQAISAFAEKSGWDQFFINGWKMLTDIGWAGAVAFAFFFLGGGTIALWFEFWLRRRHEVNAKSERTALSCTAYVTLTRSATGELGLSLNDNSDNVSHFVWYVNNGGTMHNTGVLVFVEFEKDILLPEVFANSGATDGEWRQFYSTNRFIFVELKGWPDGDVVLQAFDSKALGLDRRSELMVWRRCGPIDKDFGPTSGVQ